MAVSLFTDPSAHEVYVQDTSLAGKTADGHKITDIALFRLHKASMNWGFACKMPNGGELKQQLFAISKSHVVDARKLPVPKGCLEKDKADLQAALAEVESDQKMIRQFLEKPEKPFPKKIHEELMDLEQASEKEHASCEAERKTRQADADNYTANLQRVSKTGQETLQPFLDEERKQIAALDHKMQNLVAVKQFRTAEGPLPPVPQLVQETFTKILASLEEEAKKLRARLEAYQKIDDTTLGDWLKRIQFFDKFQNFRYLKLDKIPAWQVTMISQKPEGDVKSEKAGLCPAINLRGYTCDGSLVFSEDGSQMGARAFVNRQLFEMPKTIYATEILRAAPKQIDPSTPWDDLQVKVSQAAQQSFYILLFKFADNQRWSQWSRWLPNARTGIASHLVMDSSCNTMNLLTEKCFGVHLNSLMLLRVTAHFDDLQNTSKVHAAVDAIMRKGAGILEAAK